MKLSELARRIHAAPADAGAGDADITSVVIDSRKAQPGSLFAALHGLKCDGHDFVDGALQRGAVAVLSDREPVRPGVPWLKAADPRAAAALAAWALAGDPQEKLRLYGITGTNGKTTVAHLIQAILAAAGIPAGLIGTIAYDCGEAPVPAWRTTPEAADLAGFFSAMKLRGTTACVMEVSSHALALQRVHGLAFDAAVFTNLTRDHLDFHHTLEAYMAAKSALFAQLKPGGVAAINLDDEQGEKLARDLRARRPDIRVRGFGRHADAAVRPDEVALDLQGIRGALQTPGGRLEFSSPLLGEPNLQNLLAAVAATDGAGVARDAIARGIAGLHGVCGRFERIEAGQPFSVVVDYAHTDDALKCCLSTLRNLGAKRLLTVFGCGGNRDKGKRPLMGAVATRLSDIIILTSDNPRDEDPALIVKDVEPGIRAELRGGKRHEVILDRAAAIWRALELAKAGDVVVICGKGHEATQTVAGVEHPFSDQAVARAGLEHLRARHGLFVGH